MMSLMLLPLHRLVLCCTLAIAVCFVTRATAVAAQPTTAPAWRVVNLADAVPLTDLTVDGREAGFTDKLSRPQAGQTICFGELNTYEHEDDHEPVTAVPIIATRRADGAWVALPLVGEGLKDAGWNYVGAGPAPREIWGGLDTVAGERRDKFVLAHSVDGGAAFALSVFNKPCRLASFFDFAMSRDGRGRATLSLDTDVGECKAGLYHYETIDGGKTWSVEPRHEADAMIRADEVPDSEQPDAPLEGAKRTSAERRRDGLNAAPVVHAGLRLALWRGNK